MIYRIALNEWDLKNRRWAPSREVVDTASRLREEERKMSERKRHNWGVTLGILLGVVLGVVVSKSMDAIPGPVFAEGSGKATVSETATLYRNAARSIAPSVVAITTFERVKMREGGGFSFDRFGVPFYRQPRFREGVQPRGVGSGFIFDAVNGYVMTNNHVVADSERFVVRLSDKRELEAKLIGTDPQTDVAVLKVDSEKLSSAVLGDSDQMEVGDPVLAVGNPFGLLEQTVTAGIISAKGRRGLNLTNYEDFLQTDAAINVGNSGGPLVNTNGEVIGVNTAIFSRSGGYQGIGFAIPINQARKIAQKLIGGGEVIRGWMGVEMQDLLPSELKRMKIDHGASVEGVYINGPAKHAGLLPGDILLEFDGKPVVASGDVKDLVAELVPGAKVNLKVLREAQPKDLEMVVGKQPRDVGNMRNTE
jgi:serine protease Do